MKKRIISLMVALAVLLSVMTACSLKITKNKISYEDVTHEINNHLITINDNIRSCQISLDYVVYTLPCKLSEFLDNGWEIDISSSESFCASLKKKDMCIITQLIGGYNPTNEFYRYSVVATLEICTDEYSGMNIVLPGGLLFSDNITLDKIKEFYGEPNYIREEVYDDVTYYEHSGNNLNSVRFAFYSSGELRCLYLSSYKMK